VAVRADGSLRFDGSSGAATVVELLTELPVIVLIVNAAHPLDPREQYACTPLSITAWRSTPTSSGDAAWHATPEGERAFLNTADLLEAAGEA
jgi:hypothetical protein